MNNAPRQPDFLATVFWFILAAALLVFVWRMIA